MRVLFPIEKKSISRRESTILRLIDIVPLSCLRELVREELIIPLSSS
jgi:hypothetical protein